MIEWDILSAADVSWNLIVCACVCLCVCVHASHHVPLLQLFIGALKQKSVLS